MKTMTLQTEISADGKLRLELPIDLPPGTADVVVVVSRPRPYAPRQWPACRDCSPLPGCPEVPEMHDRRLVAAANRLGGTLVTKDAIIQASPQVKWLW